MGLLTQLHVLLLTPGKEAVLLHVYTNEEIILPEGGYRFSPDLEDLPRLFFGVRGGGNDEQTIQEINGDTVRTLIVCSTDTESRKQHNKQDI